MAVMGQLDKIFITRSHLDSMEYKVFKFDISMHFILKKHTKEQENTFLTFKQNNRLTLQKKLYVEIKIFT